MARDTRFTAAIAHCPNTNPIQRVALPAVGSAIASTTAGLYSYTKRRYPSADHHRRTSEGRELLRRSDAPTSPSLSLSPTPEANSRSI